VLEIIPIQSLRVAEDGGSFLEGNAVLPQVANGFARVPREHINVYTLIKEGRQAALQSVASRFDCHAWEKRLRRRNWLTAIRVLADQVFTGESFAVFPVYVFYPCSPMYVGKTGLAIGWACLPPRQGWGRSFRRN